MQLRILAVGVAFLLAGCQAVIERYGTGPVALAPSTQAAFERYKDRLGPLYFAISPDGRRSFNVYCREANCQPGNYMREALEGCRALNAGEPCSIYAVGADVVWDVDEPPKDVATSQASPGQPPAVERHGQKQALPVVRP